MLVKVATRAIAIAIAQIVSHRKELHTGAVAPRQTEITVIKDRRPQMIGARSPARGDALTAWVQYQPAKPKCTARGSVGPCGLTSQYMQFSSFWHHF